MPKGAKPERPGQIVQLDTHFVTLAPGKQVKHFTDHDPIAKSTVAKAYNGATAAVEFGTFGRQQVELELVLPACLFESRP